MNNMDKANILVDTDYLGKHGFVKDETAPEGVNRWRREVCFPGGETISVTMTCDGDATLYGIANFRDGNGRISDHRKFDGIALTIKMFEQFTDRNRDDLPDGIRSTRLKTHIV